MHARPIRFSLGPDPNGSAPVCTGPKSPMLGCGMHSRPKVARYNSLLKITSATNAYPHSSGSDPM